MYNIKGILYSIMNSEPAESTDSKIAYFIYQNIDSLDNVSATQLAKMCNVSTSAITRFCKKLGLDGFYDLYYLIKSYQRDPEAKPDKKFNIHKCPSKSISLTDYIDLQVKEIETLKDNLDVDKVFDLAHLLYEYKTIYLMGISQSLSSALNLQAALSFNGIFSQVISIPVKQKEILSNLSEETLVIIFSESGNFIKNTFGKEKLVSILSFNNCLQWLLYQGKAKKHLPLP